MTKAVDRIAKDAEELGVAQELARISVDADEDDPEADSCCHWTNADGLKCHKLNDFNGEAAGCGPGIPCPDNG